MTYAKQLDDEKKLLDKTFIVYSECSIRVHYAACDMLHWKWWVLLGRKWYTDREAVYVTFLLVQMSWVHLQKSTFIQLCFFFLFSLLSVSHRILYINYKSYGYFWCCTNFSPWTPIFFNKMHYLVNFVCIFILWQKTISYGYKN